MREGRCNIPAPTSVCCCGRGMRLAEQATGPCHEASENVESASASARAVGRDGEANQERWYHNVEWDIKCLFEAGDNESSTAERRTHPGYPKLETRSFNLPDWRDHTTVSLFYSCLFATYTSMRPILSPSYLFFTQTCSPPHSHFLLCCFNSIVLSLINSATLLPSYVVGLSPADIITFL